MSKPLGEKSFDYIIVGAGSAGCLLADRLSADPDVTVCLLEIGGSDTKSLLTRWLVRVPLGFMDLIRNAKFNWMYSYESEPSLGGRALPCPRGKILGGSSSINASHYVRGNRYDYDLWGSLGCSGWKYDDVLPLFKKMEDWRGGDSAFHGRGGALSVGYQLDPHPANKAFLEAAQEMQFRINPDYNGESQEGFGYYQLNQKNGERISSARAFLHPAAGRSNLTILTDTVCERIALNGRVAVGVDVRVQDDAMRLRARHEVIVATGAINTPQLLMLSGIGPARELRTHGITVVHDLPGVGANLQDHPITTVAYESKDPNLFGLSVKAMPWISKAPFQYVFGRKGPLTSSAFESGGFLRTTAAEDVPDVQLSFSPANVAKLATGNIIPRGHGYSIHCALLRPKSRGRLTLRSSETSAAPVIVGNFLDNPDDLRTLVAGLRITRRIATAPALRNRYDPTEIFPGQNLKTDAELETFIRTTCGTAFHPVGTCKMGVDDMSVVDPELRVYGISNLRVVDASIMPTLIGGNTNAPTMMIAEKGAELIRAVTSRP